ncbi:MAG: hypothetical protein JXA03_08745 [Bacteroidales bacterium]|nr:hypothetical protein [Bacteroidales bacterium]
MKILFVCLANTSRSPLAAEILRKKIAERKLVAEADSAGFEAHNINEPPDMRAVQTGLNHRIDISSHRAKLFFVEDFDKFDKIYAMDSVSYRSSLEFARNDADIRKIDFVMNLIRPGKNEPVPDPYFRNLEACEETFDILDQACDRIIGLIEQSQK